jgi:hypothetical protein
MTHALGIRLEYSASTNASLIDIAGVWEVVWRVLGDHSNVWTVHVGVLPRRQWNTPKNIVPQTHPGHQEGLTDIAATLANVGGCDESSGSAFRFRSSCPLHLLLPLHEHACIFFAVCLKYFSLQ